MHAYLAGIMCPSLTRGTPPMRMQQPELPRDEHGGRSQAAGSCMAGGGLFPENLPVEGILVMTTFTRINNDMQSHRPPNAL